MSDHERFVAKADDLIIWQPDVLDTTDGTVELTPEEERHVEELLEEALFDVGEDTYGDWFSGP